MLAAVLALALLASACSGAAVPAQSTVLTLAKAPQNPNDITCEFCTFAINELAKLLVSNATEGDFEKALDYLCGLLPASDQSVCRDFVSQFAPEIVQFIVNELNATAICQDFDLCPTTAKAARALVRPALKRKGPTCDICVELITALDLELESPTVTTAVENLLHPLCGELGPFAPTCVDFVDQYTPELLSFLAGELNATTVCDFIGVCPLAPEVAAQVFGASPCTEGPAYWCATPITAAHCHTTSFCAARKKQLP